MKKIKVHGIDAANGRLGEQKKRNSTAKVGRMTHVPLCIEEYGVDKPFFRPGISLLVIAL